MSNGNFIGLGTPKAQPTIGLGTPKAQPTIGLGLPKAQPGPAPAPAQAPAAQPAPRKAGIGIDRSAADRIHVLLQERGTPDAGLRIRVRGGGCTGLKYDMEFADAPAERDRVFEEHGVRIFVDPKSYIFLIGTVLSYHQGLLESGFKLENPNVKKACGCGESFSV